MPPMIFFDNPRYKINVGKKTIMTDAKSPDQSPLYFIPLIIENKPSATGRTLFDATNSSDKKYSFQIAIKLKIVTVTTPPCASGNTIF